MDQIRNCIAALAGTEYEIHLSDFFNRSARVELRRLKRLTNNGAPFPQRKEKSLKAGRPFNKKDRATTKK